MSLIDQFDKTHHRIEASIKDYSNEIRTINDSVKNRPTISDIHSDNEFGLRKATGAIRYHNKSTLIGKSHRRSKENKATKSEIMAHVVTKIVNDGCPSRANRYGFSSSLFTYRYTAPEVDLDDPIAFANHYRVPLLHQKHVRHELISEEKEVKDAISDMNDSANQLEDRRQMGKEMMNINLR
jgi:hypothetical protein